MDILALSWCGIIAFGIIMYVLLGGFDLGIGILSFFVRDEHQRDLMVSAILPVWDGNQTWLVFGAAALYGAFPLAFSTILPIMYLPLFMMVIALLLRGISFEFRLKAIKTKRAWELCFFLGSFFATFAQGLILGNFVSGYSLNESKLAVESYQWLSPFGIFCAFSLVFGYVLLGADYLIRKTSGELQEVSYKIASKIQYVILFAFIVVSLWSPSLDPDIMQRWFNPKYMAYLAILPALTIIFFLIHRNAINKKQERPPFWCTIGMFLMCYIGFMISIYPYIVPRKITYLQAATDDKSLLFMLIGAVIMLPCLLYYTYYSYRIFRGKVDKNLSY